MGKKNVIVLLLLEIYLWRKVVCFPLFCFVVMRFTKPRRFRSCSWCLWKALDKEGCVGLVPRCLDLQCKSSWILNGFFTEKLNHSWKFRRNWNVPMVLLERFSSADVVLMLLQFSNYIQTSGIKNQNWLINYLFKKFRNKF